MLFILLVYNYEYSSSQTCSLKYQFWALKNVSRGMSGPSVGRGRGGHAYGGSLVSYGQGSGQR